MNMENSDFLRLIDSKRWKIIQDYFAKVLGAGIRVVDPDGGPLTDLSNPHPYCVETIFSCPKAFPVCNQCLILSPQPSAKDSLVHKKDRFLDDPDNIYYDICSYLMNRVIIPLKTKDDAVKAYIIIGPVILSKRRTYPEYFNLSKSLGVNINELIDCVEQVKVFSFEAMTNITKLYQEIANFMLDAGIEKQKRRAELNKPDFDTHNMADMPFYIIKMLQALFETAVQGIDAERASLMLYDKDISTLTIAISKGIPNTIVKDTIVEKGEGIAGWAAKSGDVIFIDDNFNQPRLLSRLHQPQIKASLTVPLKSADRVFGVLNLSTKEEKHRFSPENINSIIQLAKMVDSALVNIDLDNLSNL